MFTISKMFSFEASHRLTGLPDKRSAVTGESEPHPCSRMHGHSYRVELILRSHALDERGFVVDYGDLKPFGEYIDTTLDHHHLNDVLEQPTAENIAKHLYGIAWKHWHDVHITVRVSETAKTWASYEQ